MSIYSSEQIKAWDQFTIQNKGITSFELMRQASQAFVNWIQPQISQENKVLVCAGPGNNGGDAVVIGKLLEDSGFQVKTLAISSNGNFSNDNLEAQNQNPNVNVVKSAKDFEVEINCEYSIIIDGLFGIGLNTEPKGIFSEIINLINQGNFNVYSIDIPSGVYSDNHMNHDSYIRNSQTGTFQCLKPSMLWRENHEAYADVSILDIGLSSEFNEEVQIQALNNTICTLPARSRYHHKGNSGKGLLIAGHLGMMGANILASRAAIATGIGVLTSHVPKNCHTIIQSAVPEAVLSIDRNEELPVCLPELDDYNAIAAGPGIGQDAQTIEMLLDLFLSYKKPLILDADALNIIAKKKWLKKIPKGSVITPHPKEFSRLFGDYETSEQEIESQIEKSKELGITIVRKDAFTTISTS